MPDGCTFHTLNAESVAERWSNAGRSSLPQCVCACCSGPAKADVAWEAGVCTRCEVLDEYQSAYIRFRPVRAVEAA